DDEHLPAWRLVAEELAVNGGTLVTGDPEKPFGPADHLHLMPARRQTFREPVGMGAFAQIEPGDRPVHIDHQAVFSAIANFDLQFGPRKIELDRAARPAETRHAGCRLIESPDKTDPYLIRVRLDCSCSQKN